jgi:hypothetical protein
LHQLQLHPQIVKQQHLVQLANQALVSLILEYERLAAEKVVADFLGQYFVDFDVRNSVVVASDAAVAAAAAVLKLCSVEVESQVQIVVVLVAKFVASVGA